MPLNSAPFLLTPQSRDSYYPRPFCLLESRGWWMTVSGSNYRWCLFAILAAALALRLGAGWWWESRLPAGTRFGFGDSEGYWELARAIARGGPYEYGPLKYKVFRTPGYPLVLAPLFVVGREPPVMW